MGRPRTLGHILGVKVGALLDINRGRGEYGSSKNFGAHLGRKSWRPFPPISVQKGTLIGGGESKGRPRTFGHILGVKVGALLDINRGGPSE